MPDGPVYLKSNVLFQPLINQWYASSYLLFPVTAAMYMANLQMKIMDSFVTAPQTHVAALKNPAMIGGPFVNYGPERVGELRELLDTFRGEHADMLALAGAVRDVVLMLEQHAKGYSLQSLYSRVPSPLKGYVELVYDLNNNPAFRILEGMLYHSPYYKTKSQSVLLELIEADDRAFVLSTPRLQHERSLQVRLPFAAESYDRLHQMKRQPAALEEIRNDLEVSRDQEDLFSSFFTCEKPSIPSPVAPGRTRFRYFGHACILVESAETTILCDPVISYRYQSEVDRFTFADLPERLDYVLITHNHQDHFSPETLLQLRHMTKHVIVPKSGSSCIADISLKLVLENMGFRSVIEADELQTIAVQGGSITSIPFLGEHADVNIRGKSAWLIDLNGRRFLLAADSNNLEPALYGHLASHLNNIDVLALGMECDGAPLSWIYGPFLTKPLPRAIDQSRRLDGSNFERAIDIVRQLGPRRVYVYAMGEEPWLTHLSGMKYTAESRPIMESNKLLRACQAAEIESERLFGKKELTFVTA